MNESITIEGTIESIIFYNAENGYTVFSVLASGEDDVTCTGHMPELKEGESVKLAGSFIVHPSYGKQFNVEWFEKTMPSSAARIEKYLASGVVKGIGERLAKRIVKVFGDDTLEVMENQPEKLAKIKGITPERALSISAVFHEQAELRRIMLFLQDYGISPAYALKIYKKYKDNTFDMVKKNPYALADDIIGIGFKTADAIARRVGIERDSPYRIRAGIRYALSQASNDGHVYLPKGILMKMTGELLEIEEDFIENDLLQLQLDRIIWQENINGNICVYLNTFYHAESYVAQKLIGLSANAVDKSKGIPEEIRKVEAATGIILADNQKKAVFESAKNGVLVITGGPGTGKTTTINTIINILQKYDYEIELAAPTGRAAKRMSEATGMKAKTIHRLLGISYMSEDSKKQTFEKDEDSPIEADAVIIDESSMVDILLMNSLLKAIAPGTRLILVGDVDQLPSVGPGNVLKDIIGSGCINVVRLTEIFRQAQESAIVMNAHRINKGEYPVLNEKEKDFFFMKRLSPDDVVNTLLELVTKRLPSYVGCDIMQDIQVLTPMRKSQLGVYSLNSVLQMHLNPPSIYKKEKEFRSVIFREGDKVMHIKNNYNLVWKTLDEKGSTIEEGLGVFNGDCGIIRKIDDENELVTVWFDDNRVVEYDYAQLEELELSYAITIHKSQGSEYRVVVIPILSGPPMLMSRNLLYTAVTRAKQLAVIVGSPDMLYRMVDNNREVDRYSSLDHRILKMNELIQ